MWWKIAIGIVACIIALVAASTLIGKIVWQRQARLLTEELTEMRRLPDDAVLTIAEIDYAPQPVKRYFRTVLAEDQALVTEARIRHSGTFNMGTDEERWLAFSSVQHVVVSRSGFVWNARIAMAPGAPARVLDAYVGGRGILTAKLLGLIPVMELPETPELAQSELMRFLAEAPWYPTALVPGAGVSWDPVDAQRARVTLVDGPTAVSLEVRFDNDGLIESVYSDGRYRDVDGVQVTTPWEGRFWNYQERGGMLIPLDGEVAWLLPEGSRPYWRGHIDEIVYEFAQ